MIGSVVVMRAPRFQHWLGAQRHRRHARRARAAAVRPATGAAAATAPAARCARRRWTGCTERRCRCADGSTVIADERYIRDSILNPQPAGGRELRAGDAVLRWRDWRGRSVEARRLHRIARRASMQMSERHERSRRTSLRRAAELSRRRHDDLRSWLLTTDHKRIALLYLRVDHGLLLSGRRRCGPDPLNLIIPQGALVVGRDVQPAVQHARRRDGVVLPGAGDAGHHSATSSSR